MNLFIILIVAVDYGDPCTSHADCNGDGLTCYDICTCGYDTTFYDSDTGYCIGSELFVELNRSDKLLFYNHTCKLCKKRYKCKNGCFMVIYRKVNADRLKKCPYS